MVEIKWEILNDTEFAEFQQELVRLNANYKRGLITETQYVTRIAELWAEIALTRQAYDHIAAQLRSA